MRLAPRQVWRVVADCAHDLGKAAGEQSPRQGKPGHAGDAENDQDRYQRPAASLRSEPVADERAEAVRRNSIPATSSTAYTGSRSLPRSTRARGCPLSLSICSRTLPFPSGARVNMNTDPGTVSEARNRFEASAAAWCE